MTGQSLLNLMEALNPELQLQATEDDVTRGLVVLNAAQDIFETLLAQHPGCLGNSVGTVTTSASTESTAFPTGMLRLDRLYYIDASTSRPAWKLSNIREIGGHGGYAYWPSMVSSANTGGKPKAYYTDGANIYWNPLPDGTHTVRWHGLNDAADITAAGTFAYPDAAALPIAIVACRIIKVGLEDPTQELTVLAKDVMEPVIETFRNFNRDGGTPLQYIYRHDT